MQKNTHLHRLQVYIDPSLYSFITKSLCWKNNSFLNVKASKTDIQIDTGNSAIEIPSTKRKLKKMKKFGFLK